MEVQGTYSGYTGGFVCTQQLRNRAGLTSCKTAFTSIHPSSSALTGQTTIGHTPSTLTPFCNLEATMDLNVCLWTERKPGAPLNDDGFGIVCVVHGKQRPQPVCHSVHVHMSPHSFNGFSRHFVVKMSHTAISL